MTIETYEQRILIPNEGHWLYNAKAHVISDKVYLGKTANAIDWIEITDAEKEVIENQINEGDEV